IGSRSPRRAITSDPSTFALCGARSVLGGSRDGTLQEQPYAHRAAPRGRPGQEPVAGVRVMQAARPPAEPASGPSLWVGFSWITRDLGRTSGLSPHGLVEVAVA